MLNHNTLDHKLTKIDQLIKCLLYCLLIEHHLDSYSDTCNPNAAKLLQQTSKVSMYN